MVDTARCYTLLIAPDLELGYAQRYHLNKKLLPMPQDRLSEPERRRLAQLMKAPILAPPPPTPERRSSHLPFWHIPTLAAVFSSANAHRRAWVAGSLSALGCMLVLAAAVRLGKHTDYVMAQLRADDSHGQLQISWDAQSDVARNATGAKLYITDGPQRLFVNLDRRRLQRGTVMYARQSGRVDLRMDFAQPDGHTIAQNIVFLGTPIPEATPSDLAVQAIPEITVPPPDDTGVQPGAPGGSIEHRSRRKPLVQSGTTLPFTCSAGDVFHKTDAPTGWDMFSCRGKNVWSLAPANTGTHGSAEHSAVDPNAVTVQPAPASTT